MHGEGAGPGGRWALAALPRRRRGARRSRAGARCPRGGALRGVRPAGGAPWRRAHGEQAAPAPYPPAAAAGRGLGAGTGREPGSGGAPLWG